MADKENEQFDEQVEERVINEEYKNSSEHFNVCRSAGILTPL